MEETKQQQHMMTDEGPASMEDLNETEDEEVKRNCFGKKFYTSSCSSDEDTFSQESSDSDCDKDDEDHDECSTITSCTESELSSDEEPSSSTPQTTKFTFDLSKCGPGLNIFKPKPVTFQTLQGINKKLEQDREELSNGSNQEEEEDESGYEHEDDEDEGEESETEISRCDNDDDSSFASSVNSKTESQTSLTCGYSETDASVSDHEDSDHQVLEQEGSSDEESTSSKDENEAEICETTDEESSFEEDDTSVLSHASNNEDAYVISQHHQGSEDDTEVIVQWDINGDDIDYDDEINYVNTIAISGSATCSESSSISDEDLESIMEKVKEEDSDETLLLRAFSASNSRANDSEGAQDQEDWRSDDEARMISPSKRALEGDDMEQNEGSEVRYKRSRTEAFGSQSCQPPPLPFLSSRASDFTKLELSRRDLLDDLPSYGNDEVDSQLAEELLGCVSPMSVGANSNPIPLLTPAASPIPIKSDESLVEIYEWPSNLAVDNALTAAKQLRPMSPSSLAKLEEDDQRREAFTDLTLTFPRKVRSITRDFTSPQGDSGLTPILGTMIL